MARRGKNEVVLTFAGDSSDLEKAFDRVGSSAKQMSGEVGAASRDMRDAGDGFDRAAAGADNAEGKAQGLASTLEGTRDTALGLGMVMRGDTFGGMVMLGQGAADLAEGLNYTVIPTIKAAARAFTRQGLATIRATVASGAHKVAMLAGAAATGVMTVAQRALNAVMRANPILLIVTLLATLVGAIVLAYRKSETFRNIVKGAMDVARRAIGFVVDKGQALWEFFRDLPGKLAGSFRGMWDGIKDAFRSAVNFVIDGWNSLSFTLPSIDTVFGRIGGWTLSTPRIDRLHRGGIVPGAPGQESMAILQAGERVTPAGAVSGGRTVIELRSGGTALDDALVEILARAIRARGGDVQLVIGSA